MTQSVTNQYAGSPWIEIIEQPAPKSLRFRYASEKLGTGNPNRTTRGIVGVTSGAKRKTFPAIKVHNLNESCVVVVSCVTLDDPKAKAHPHSLVGAGCSEGIFTKKVGKNEDKIEFKGLAIQCTKKGDVIPMLNKRKENRVDPFGAGFAHASDSVAKDIDLTAVRLCFQAFLPDSSGKYTRVVPPVCTTPIYDAKTALELLIVDYLPESGLMRGQEKMVILTQRLPKDVKVRFFEMEGDALVWEAFAEISTPKDIHQQVALRIKTPLYNRSTTINSAVKVLFELRDNCGESSEPREFQYLQNDQAYRLLKRRGEGMAGATAYKKVKHAQEIPSLVESMTTSSLSSSDRSSLLSGEDNQISTSTANPCTWEDPLSSQSQSSPCQALGNAGHSVASPGMDVMSGTTVYQMPSASYAHSGIQLMNGEGSCTNSMISAQQSLNLYSGHNVILGPSHSQQVSSEGLHNGVLSDMGNNSWAGMYQTPVGVNQDYFYQVFSGEGSPACNDITTGLDRNVNSWSNVMDDLGVQQPLQGLPQTESTEGSMSLGGNAPSNEFFLTVLMNPSAPLTENYSDMYG